MLPLLTMQLVLRTEMVSRSVFPANVYAEKLHSVCPVQTEIDMRSCQSGSIVFRRQHLWHTSSAYLLVTQYVSNNIIDCATSQP